LLPDGNPRPESDDILNILTLQRNWPVTVYAAYLWDITTIIPGIPVLAIMVCKCLFWVKLGAIFMAYRLGALQFAVWRCEWQIWVLLLGCVTIFLFRFILFLIVTNLFFFLAIGVVSPWIVTMFMYQQNELTNFCK
jgi:hypothetical protein